MEGGKKKNPPPRSFTVEVIKTDGSSGCEGEFGFDRLADARAGLQTAEWGWVVTTAGQ